MLIHVCNGVYKYDHGPIGRSPLKNGPHNVTEPVTRQNVSSRIYLNTLYRGLIYLLSSPWQGIPGAVGTLGNTGTNKKERTYNSIPLSTM
jgi:hypothetical protein